MGRLPPVSDRQVTAVYGHMTGVNGHGMTVLDTFGPFLYQNKTRPSLRPHCAAILTTEDSQIAQGRRPTPQACVTSERPLRALHLPCVAHWHSPSQASQVRPRG